MIDLNWLNSQPACQLAREHLKNRRAMPHPFQCHLLTLLLDYLDGLQANPDPKGYMADLQQAAHELGFPRREEFTAVGCGTDVRGLRAVELDLDKNPEKEQDVLEEHLGQLHRAMQDEGEEVGHLLAENLFNSLH